MERDSRSPRASAGADWLPRALPAPGLLRGHRVDAHRPERDPGRLGGRGAAGRGGGAGFFPGAGERRGAFTRAGTAAASRAARAAARAHRGESRGGWGPRLW